MGSWVISILYISGKTQDLLSSAPRASWKHHLYKWSRKTVGLKETWAVSWLVCFRLLVPYPFLHGPNNYKDTKPQMSASLKNLANTGTWRQVFICLRPRSLLPPVTHCMNTCTPVLIHTVKTTFRFDIFIDIWSMLSPNPRSLGKKWRGVDQRMAPNIRAWNVTS